MVLAAGVAALLLAACIPGVTSTPTLHVRDCGVPGTDPVFEAWRKACEQQDPRADGAPWGTIPPGYSPPPGVSP